MNKEQAKQLLDKYNAAECTEAEKVFVEKTLLEFNEHEIDLSQERLDELKDEVYAKLPVHIREKIRLYAWASEAAAVVVLILAIAHWNCRNGVSLDTPFFLLKMGMWLNENYSA